MLLLFVDDSLLFVFMQTPGSVVITHDYVDFVEVSYLQLLYRSSSRLPAC